MASGPLFPSMSNPTSRGALQKRILSQDCLIPTFGDFWRNSNYFCLLRKVVALVLPGVWNTPSTRPYRAYTMGAGRLNGRIETFGYMLCELGPPSWRNVLAMAVVIR